MKRSILKNYKNVEYTDENGKIKTRVEYVGKIFDFENGVKPLLNVVLFTALTLVCLCAFILSLALDSKPLRTLYFTLPFVVQIFPLFSLLTTTVKYLTVKLPFEEKDKERLVDKPQTACVLGLILAAITLVCYIIEIIYVGFNVPDLLPVLTNVFCFATYFVLYFLTLKTKTVCKNIDANPEEIVSDTSKRIDD